MKEYLATKTEKSFIEEWVAKLITQVIFFLSFYEQYPADSGVFAPFLLKLLLLKRGEAIYLGADIPHAYLSGMNNHLSFPQEILLRQWPVVTMWCVPV